MKKLKEITIYLNGAEYHYRGKIKVPSDRICKNKSKRLKKKKEKSFKIFKNSLSKAKCARAITNINRDLIIFESASNIFNETSKRAH